MFDAWSQSNEKLTATYKNCNSIYVVSWTRMLHMKATNSVDLDQSIIETTTSSTCRQCLFAWKTTGFFFLSGQIEFVLVQILAKKWKSERDESTQIAYYFATNRCDKPHNLFSLNANLFSLSSLSSLFLAFVCRLETHQIDSTVSIGGIPFNFACISGIIANWKKIEFFFRVDKM